MSEPKAKYILFMLAILFFACGKKPLKEEAKKQNEVVSGVKNDNPIPDDEEFTFIDPKECDTDFDLFFKKFKTDSVFQKKHVKFPYMFYYSDEDTPLDMKEKMFWKEDYKAIDFSALMHTYPYTDSPFKEFFNRKKDSVSYYKISTLNSTKIEYQFVSENGCWYMVEVIDNTD